MDFTKATLRKEFQQRRLQLSLQEMHSMLALMIRQMEQMKWPDGNLVMSYRSLAKRHELPIHFFEDALNHFKEGLIWCYPRVELSDCSMEAIIDDESTEWQRSSFDIDEPVIGTPANPENIDIIFVPLLAFDEKGYRVGYGKGFYDRFLKRCNPAAVTIGFSWFPPVPAIEDINANDVPLKYCITPHQLYAF